jgi:undecaprenyl phosphate N,N'-diacetylbacillosamine 1-phosphate transferase
MYRTLLKPLIDFLLSLIALLLASSVLLVLTGLLAFTNGGKPFFFQRRPGRHGKVFKVIKFKTMNDQKDEYGNIIPDNERLTCIGNFIRKTSLDEIPQLINVLKGDMSLIGPRPLLIEYLPLYNDFQKRRHEVRPGITGWAQVNGRNAISWPEKFEFDVWYVDNISFWLDIRILWLTVIKVFKSEGISQPGQASMEPFKGNN